MNNQKPGLCCQVLPMCMYILDYMYICWPSILGWESSEAMSVPLLFDRGKEYESGLFPDSAPTCPNHLTLTMPYFAYLLA